MIPYALNELLHLYRHLKRGKTVPIGRMRNWWFKVRCRCLHARGCGARTSGFTLIEVLLALSVIAIALTALLKAISQNVETSRRIKEKTVSHWIAMQAVAMVQLNLLQINQSQETTQDTSMLNEHWYWRVKVNATPQKNIQKINVFVSTEKTGPYREELQAFRYIP